MNCEGTEVQDPVTRLLIGAKQHWLATRLYKTQSTVRTPSFIMLSSWEAGT